MVTVNFSELLNITRDNDDTLIVSDTMVSRFFILNTWGIVPSVIIVGMIVNVLNIVVFVRQGVRDTVNISLLALSVSDFGSLFINLLMCMCWMPSIHTMGLPFYPGQMANFLVWMHNMFIRVTTGTTAWITFERCLCIMAPMKIKSIVTPGRTVLFIAVIYIIMFGTVAPALFTTEFVWMFDSNRNKSLLGFARTANSENIRRISFWANIVLPTIFFIFITVCTVILVKVLRKHAQWKEQSVTSQNQKSVSNRDTKVAKMVSIISIVFIACYAPGSIVYLFMAIYPEFTYTGEQRNLLYVIGVKTLYLEVVNASANFFIYLKMSSRFKCTFKSVFCFFCNGVNPNEDNVRDCIP